MNDEGFTLWECLCVLLVISILAIMPILKIEKWREKQTAASQLILFERLYERSQHSAVVEQEQSKVKTISSSQCLFFSYTFKGEKIEEKIEINRPLYIQKDSEVTLQSGSASPSVLETFEFYDDSTQTSIRYVVQLGSSKVFKYVEKK